MENETNKSGKLNEFGDLLDALEQIAEDQYGMLVGDFAVVGDQPHWSCPRLKQRVQQVLQRRQLHRWVW